MMRNKLKPLSKWILILSAVMIPHQACGPAFQTTSDAATEASTSASLGGGSSSSDATDSYKVTHIRELLPNLTETLNTTPSDTARQTTTLVEANLSEDGESDSVSAPMWNSILSISGTLCNETVAKEKLLAPADRTLFKSFDFTKAPNAQPANAVPDLVRTLARRSWQRNETAEELQTIEDATKDYSTSTVADTAEEALFICSAMISSLDSVIR